MNLFKSISKLTHSIILLIRLIICKLIKKPILYILTSKNIFRLILILRYLCKSVLIIILILIILLILHILTEKII